MSQYAVLFFILVKLIAISYCIPLNFTNVPMHPKCQNRTYCFERGEDYPEDLIDALVKKTELQNIDVAIPEHRQTTGTVVTICEIGYTMDPIYQVKDKNDNVRYVVQATRFKQIIKLEWCRSKGKMTEDHRRIGWKNKDTYFSVDDLAREDQTAYCIETYTNYQFLVLAGDGKSLESVHVEGIPVCCQCEIYPTGKEIDLHYGTQ